jgi:RNA polymerase sigma-70 factor (ECF subfamily)
MIGSLNVLDTSMRELALPPRLSGVSTTGSPSPADVQASQLAAAVGRGDEAAFTVLYDRYQDRLFRLTLSLNGGDESTAHEIVQSVFVIAAGKLRRAAGEEHLWNWLAQVTRQQLARIWRQRKREVMVAGVEDLPELAATRPDDGLAQNLDEALLALEAEDRQLMEWFYFENLSHKDIAGRLATTAKAVSGRLARTRSRLRAWLSRKHPHEP